MARVNPQPDRPWTPDEARAEAEAVLSPDVVEALYAHDLMVIDQRGFTAMEHLLRDLRIFANASEDGQFSDAQLGRLAHWLFVRTDPRPLPAFLPIYAPMKGDPDAAL